MNPPAAPASGAAGVAAAAVPVPVQDLVLHNAPLMEELQAAARRVLRSGRFILGSSPQCEVDAFEVEAAAQLGTAHAVGVSSGTDALLAMLMATGVGPGDEVVTTPFSFFATAGAIARLGARIIFADVDPATLTLDPQAAVERFSARTKAVLTVHLFGRPAPCEALAAACASRGVRLLEDAAQAIGASHDGGRPVGTVGSAAALSFFPTKNLGGFGDGGMVVTNDGAFAASIRLLRTHGAKAKFHHTLIGGNFRLDEMQAALLRVKLPHLPGWIASRRRLAALYRTALAQVPLCLPPDDAGCVWNQFVVRVARGAGRAPLPGPAPGAEQDHEYDRQSDGRDALAAYLGRHQIGTGIYYPEPLHLQPCFAALGHRSGDFPVAEKACDEVLALPIYPELTEQQVRQVVAAIRDFFAHGATTRTSGGIAARLDSVQSQK